MRQNKRLTKASTRLMSALLLVGLGIGISGCVSTEPVDHPCGVIVDSLKDIHAQTRDGERRISDHYERGRSAHCWL